MQQQTWASPFDESERRAIYTLRERQVAIEKDTEHLHERALETTKRIEEGEARAGRISSRVRDLEQVNFARLKLESRLEELPDRLTRLESDQRQMKERLKWMMFALLFFMSGMVASPDLRKAVTSYVLNPPGIGG